MIQFVLALLSVGFAVFPMCMFLFFVWWNDRYDREPWWMVALAFLWGAVGAVTMALVGSLLLMVPMNYVLTASAAAAAGAVVVAPLVEEPMKALILGPIALTRHFDNMTDGFVYGAAAGLGFGMTENFLYFVGTAMEGNVATWVATVVIRTFFSAVMHSIATSIVGAAMGLAAFRGCLARLVLPVVGLGTAMGVHALWNGLLTAEEAFNTGGALFGMNLLLLPAEFLLVFLIFQACLWDERRMIRRELADEAASGLIPNDHAKAVTSWLRRLFAFWVPRGVRRRAYIQALTTLAFRKSQLRRARSSQRAFYEKEVQRWRTRVQELLATAR